MLNFPCIANELRKDLRKWITPPDPSVNYNAASSAHHMGTVEWCTRKYTLDWMKSGSLFWIYGKRNISSPSESLLLLMTLELIAGSGKTILRYVTPLPSSCVRVMASLNIEKLRDHPGY